MSDTLLLNFESGIKDLIEAFKSNPYSFYSENDLHCSLFHILDLSLNWGFLAVERLVY